jgi:hypothetical protein
MPNTEEIVPHTKMGVNRHVGFAQSHECQGVQDPRGGQVVQL